ncbi:hypothetical protein [Streptomyces carpaticus]|uniref:Uncharacterized protein n=1 Tax=Streptomyces carpaticus TaxID=285558 RepID=A0ABV4ZG19_9ACTN
MAHEPMAPQAEVLLETVTPHSEPGTNDYRTVLPVTYGKSLLLP